MTANKITDLALLKTWVKNWQEKGGKVVFTNGCFDIVHLGHIDYLENASKLGDKLVIGVNTDASVKKLKGQTRPVVDENARARMMAAFEFTDAVILFEEETPEQLIRSICPDILVKGDDYTIQNIVGADFVLANGGEVKTISLVKGYSTSNIIEKIKQII